MSYTLATAADAAKVAKPTMWRWIKAGRLSATRLDDGSYRIDPSELDRFLSTIKETAVPQRTETPVEAHNDTGPEPITLRSEIDKLRALLEAEKQRSAEWKAEADRWATQAERLTIAAPAPIVTPVAPATVPADDAVVNIASGISGSVPTVRGAQAAQHSRGWWPFRRAG
jgi:excisionase family DNA binding protein